MKTIRNGLFGLGVALWNAFRVRHQFIKEILIGSLSIVTLFTFSNMTNYSSAQMSVQKIESQIIYPGYKIVTEEEKNLEQKNQNVDRGYVGEGVFFLSFGRTEANSNTGKGEE